METDSLIQSWYRIVCRQPTATVLSIALASVVLCALLWWFDPVLNQHGGTAAWVQAAGALLIIGATAWIAGRSSREANERERSAKRQLWASIAALARNCFDAIDELLKKNPSTITTDAREGFLRSYEPSDFEVPMDGLTAIPLHEIGDTNLITAVLTLRGVMGRIKRHLDEVYREPNVSQTLEPVRHQRTPAFNALASVLRIVEGHSAENEISRLAGRV